MLGTFLLYVHNASVIHIKNLSTISVKLFRLVFRRNAAHCISPYAIAMCVCVCVCVCLSVCLCVYAAFVDLRKTV